MRVGIIDIVLFLDEVLYCLSLDEGECKGCFAMPGVKRGNALIDTNSLSRLRKMAQLCCGLP